jgi:subtilisin family serine protease
MTYTSVLRTTAQTCAVLLVAACDRQGPLAPSTTLATTFAGVVDSARFYFHQGLPIYLENDSRYLVVSTPVSNAGAAAAQVLSQRGMTVNVERSMPQAPGHTLLRLLGTTSTQLRGAARDLSADPRFEFASEVFRTVVGSHEFIPLNRIDVQFRPRVSGAVIDSVVRSLGMEVIRPPRPDSGFFAYRLRYARGADPLEISRVLDRHPLVEWASPDAVTDVKLAVDPTDPYFGQQFHLKNSIMSFGVPVDINVAPAWSASVGSGVTVAIVDDGIDVLHWNSGQGFAGDLVGVPLGMGYDLLWDPSRSENSLYPCCNDTHGSAIAGIVAASHNNGIGGAGISPGARLVAVRIFRRTYPPESFFGTEVASSSQIADGINWAWQHAGSDIISNSWGGGAPSNAITSAITNALSMGRNGKGAVVVFAAGNTSNRSVGVIGSVTYPATLSSSKAVISVGAINRFGAVTNYSPGSGPIDVVAPSGHVTGSCVGEVVTTDRYGSPGCNDGPSGDQSYTATFSGTSAAAPQVSAVAALLLSVSPGLTAEQVKSRIKSSANAWGSAAVFGSGKLNAYAALAPSLPPPPPPFVVSIVGPAEVQFYSSCHYYASVQGGSGSYTFEWRSNDVVVGTNQEINHSVGDSQRELTVSVTDSQQRVAFGSLLVTVSPSASPCYDQE